MGRNSSPAASRSALMSALSAVSSPNIASADSHAWRPCLASSSGAFQNAMMQSPMYLSMVPLRSRIRSDIGVRKRLIRLVSPWGAPLNSSEMPVNPGNRLCTLFRRNQHVVGDRFGADGDGEQGAEGGVARSASVEAEDELVEIGLQVFPAQPVIDPTGRRPGGAVEPS